MIAYTAKKVRWLLSTLLMVGLVCFLLHVNMPGDPVVTILNKRGLTAGDLDVQTYNTEYAKIASALGTDNPYFYISLKPDFYNQLSNGWNATEMKLARNMLRHKYAPDGIELYLSSLNELQATVQNESLNNISRELAYLYVEDQKDDIISRLEKMIVLLPEDHKSKGEQCLSAYKKMVDKKYKFYFPSISWNGTENQFHYWVKSIFGSGNENFKLDNRSSVVRISTALKWTLMLSIVSIFISTILGVAVACIMSRWEKSNGVKAINILLYGLYSIPVFWMATLLIVFFTTPEYGRWTDIFTSPMPQILEGDNSVLKKFFSNIEMMVLPIICMILYAVPVIARLMQMTLKEEKRKPYVQTLKAKGTSEGRLLMRHLLPNSLVPLITLISNYLPASLAGTLILEVIFNIPGMGRLLYGSITSGETNLVFGIILLITVVTTITLMLSDFLYRAVDPKIKISD